MPGSADLARIEAEKRILKHEAALEKAEADRDSAREFIRIWSKRVDPVAEAAHLFLQEDRRAP